MSSYNSNMVDQLCFKFCRDHAVIMGYQEIKLELPDVPKLKLKTLFLLHLLLISWASLGIWANQVRKTTLNCIATLLNVAGGADTQLDVSNMFCVDHCPVRDKTSSDAQPESFNTDPSSVNDINAKVWSDR